MATMVLSNNTDVPPLQQEQEINLGELENKAGDGRRKGVSFNKSMDLARHSYPQNDRPIRASKRDSECWGDSHETFGDSFATFGESFANFGDNSCAMDFKMGLDDDDDEEDSELENSLVNQYLSRKREDLETVIDFEDEHDELNLENDCFENNGGRVSFQQDSGMKVQS
jgi:hypothetical protein